ncbi:MAG: helix-turn-helix transcriptional regulator, partial [Bacteroidales bacterium]|nr:helix-turn-helix transcriptional regulator [Bacteroidales bacterium]
LEKEQTGIPSYELMHNGETVDFAIRSVEEVIAIFGSQTDVPHRHNYYTVLWSQNESGKHIIDYREYQMHANDVFFVNPGQVHQVLHNNNPEGVVILFTCEFLEKNYININFITNLGLFADISETPPIRINEKSALLLKDITDSMMQAMYTDEIFKFDTIGAFLKLFLIECNKFAPSLVSDNTQTIQSAKSIMRRFKDMLEKNFLSMRKVSEYAEQLNISPDYLNNVIKSGIGKTAKELIQQRIILEAKRFGLHTQLSTKEIAYQLGFEDPSHFSRFFKNTEGISFADFRNELEKELLK